MKRFVFAAVTVLSLSASGCTSFELATFRKLAKYQAVIGQAQLDYERGAIRKTRAAYVAITSAKAMEQIAVHEFVIYGSVKGDGDDQLRRLSSVMAQLPDMISAVEAADPDAAKAPPATAPPVPEPALTAPLE